MSSHTTTILADVQTGVLALVPGVSFGFGMRTLAIRKAGPRIVWVPTTDRYDAARAGARTAPRSVRTRVASLTAFVLADDYDAAEALVHAFVYALHASAHGSYEVDRGEWINPDWLQHGFACAVSFTLMVPVTAPAPTTAVINQAGFDTTNTVRGDGFLDAGEST